MIEIDDHPLLNAAAIRSHFPYPLGELETPPEILEFLAVPADAPLTTSDDVKNAVRDLLRHGGYKPTGRGKPSAEYLIKAVGDGRLGSINPAVDVCNIVSLHSGLPISVVDLDQLTEPLSIAIAEKGTEYVFNASGQTMSLGGLLCLFDADGPCANGVKDSQRTKTSDATTQTVSIIWGTNALPGRTTQVAEWYTELLERCGAEAESVALRSAK